MSILRQTPGVYKKIRDVQNMLQNIGIGWKASWSD